MKTNSADYLDKTINGFKIIGLGKSGKNRLYECLCLKCNSVSFKSLGCLKNRLNPHCGCEQYESSKRKHGLYKSREYKAWLNMKARVCNKNTPMYKIYVERYARDIDPRWMTFDNFISDMGYMPDPKSTLERVDNSRGYWPDNCIWASAAVQARNTSRNIFCEYEGTIYCLKDLCNKLSIRYNTVVTRIHRGHTDPFALSNITNVRIISSRDG